MRQIDLSLTRGRRSRLLCAAALAALISLSTVLLPLTSVQAQAPDQSGCGGVDVPSVDAAFEAQLVELVNQARATHGNLPPLKRVDALDRAAQYHATDLGVDNYFNHPSYDRTAAGLVLVCDTFERINRWYTGWRSAGENIGAGYATPADVVAAWMDGEGHRRNLLSENYTEIGVGYYRGAGAYASYWVQDFGARHGVFPLVINWDAAITDERAVELYIYGGWDEVRLRNGAGAWSEWQPFANRLPWLLDAAAGEQTVTAEVRRGATLYSAADTITLEGVVAPPTPAPAATPSSTPTAQGASHRFYLPTVVK